MTGCRTALAAMVALALVTTSGQAARAQEYPSRDIHLIVGFPPGTGADILVRYFAEKLKPLAQQSVIVENKPGANSNIATEYVARAKPDGYTLYPFSASTVAATSSINSGTMVLGSQSWVRPSHKEIKSMIRATRRKSSGKLPPASMNPREKCGSTRGFDNLS